MSGIILHPYLFFKGQCHEAMEFYQSVLGGTLNTVPYSGDMVNDQTKDWLMHASLTGGIADLLASDTELASPEAKKITLSLNGSDEAKLREIFDALSVEGRVITPLRIEFWGDIFGNVTDKYGIEWMINISKPTK